MGWVTLINKEEPLLKLIRAGDIKKPKMAY